MKSVPIIIITTLSAGILVGYLLVTTGPGPEFRAQKPEITNGETDYLDRAAIDELSSRIEELEQRLQTEVNARQVLEATLEILEQQLANNAQIKTPDLIEENAIDIGPKENASTQVSASDWFNAQALIDSGMSSSQAAELKSFFERQELERMFLRDRSIREDWDRQKYRDELRKLTENTRAYFDQLDENAYDAYLYASGQTNRVRVTSVLDSSQAGSAGIQPGDHILRYDNKRIYSGFELRSATTSGDLDQSVAVEVERDGEIHLLYLNRGPLGIRMNSVSVAPSP